MGHSFESLLRLRAGLDMSSYLSLALLFLFAMLLEDTVEIADLPS